MAGNTLDRPLFKRGPQGDMRPAFKYGGLDNLFNLINPFKWGKGKQGELFKYTPNKDPLIDVDPITGDATEIPTQTIVPKKRYDIDANVWGQDMDEYFYNMGPWLKKQKKINEMKKTPPFIEKTPEKTTTNLFGETIVQPGTTKINWPEWNNPFGEFRKNWRIMPKDQKKKYIRNIMATTTGYALLPDWMKEGEAYAEVIQENEKKDVIETLEEEGLPTPALSYKEAVIGAPSIGEREAEEYVKLADEEINQKKKELKEEREILNPEPVSIGEREAEYDKSLSEKEREGADDMGAGEGQTMFDLINAYLGEDTEVDAKGIEETKAELKSLMGDDSKLMNTMMLMQLGLSLMSGETRKSGLAGFMEVAGKAGNEILPIVMQNLKDKSNWKRNFHLRRMILYVKSVQRKQHE